MKRLLLLLLLLPFTLVAQAPAGYYTGTEDLNGAELKTKLHTIIRGHRVRTYNQLWTDFRSTDTRPNGTIWCIWTHAPFIFGPASQGGQQQGTGGAQTVGQVYNREHVFCSSWLNPDRSQAERMHAYTDLFHMYPVDALTNTRRSDNPFGVVGTPTFQTMTAPNSTATINSKLGPNVFPGYTGTVFEPDDQYKGDMARTLFYMVTRYEDEICLWGTRTRSRGGQATMDGSSFPALQPWKIELLMQWHHADPVSDKERARNDSVFKIQGNRNPFIDHPEFADSIWGFWLKNRDIRIFCDGTIPPPVDQPFPEDFETLRGGGESNNYNGVDMLFGTGEWFVKGMTNMDANDRRNGERSVRLRGNNTDGDHRVEMNFDKPDGIGTVTFNYGSYSTHQNGQLQLQVSTDQGTSWQNYGSIDLARAWNGEFQVATIIVNEPRPARIRIVNLSATGTKTINVDDIHITDHIAELQLSIEVVDFGEQIIETSSPEVVIQASAVNHINAITYDLDCENPGVFVIHETSWNSTTGGSLSVIFTPKTEQEYNAVITFRTDGAEDDFVVLTGIGRYLTQEELIERLYEQIQALQSDTARLHADTLRLYAQVLALQSDTVRLHADTLRLYAQVLALQSDTAQLRTDTANLNSIIVDLQKDVSEHLAIISALKIDTAQLRIDTVRLYAQTLALQTNITKQNDSIIGLHDSIKGLHQLITECDNSKLALQDSIKVLHQLIADCKNIDDITILQDSINKLLGQNQTLATNNNRLIQDTMRLYLFTVELLGEIDDFFHTTSQLYQTIDQLYETINELNDTIGRLNNTVKRLNDTINHLRELLAICDPSSAVERQNNASVQVWVQNNVLYISGLPFGQPWHIYNISGTLVCQGIATTNVVETQCIASLPFGTYIIRSGGRSIKFVW